MKNFVQPGDAITLDAPEAILSGAGLLVGDLFGVAAVDAVPGDPVTIHVVGVYDLPKAAGALTVGQPVHWDAGAGVATADDTESNRMIGHAVAASSGGAATARVRLAV